MLESVSQVIPIKHLLIFGGILALSFPLYAADAFRINFAKESELAEHKIEYVASWDEFKRIRQGDSAVTSLDLDGAGSDTEGKSPNDSIAATPPQDILPTPPPAQPIAAAPTPAVNTATPPQSLSQAVPVSAVVVLPKSDAIVLDAAKGAAVAGAATVWDPFDPIDPSKMVLESDVALDGNPNYRFKTYIHPLGAPGSNKYNRPDAPTAFKTALILPTNPPGDASLKVVTHFDGYTADPGGAGMPNWYFGAPGFITIKTHPGHYPHIDNYTVNGIGPFDMGAFAKGDGNNWRYGVGYAKIRELMFSSVDWNAGFRLEGNSWGGFAAILQSLLLKDPFAQAMVTIVNASVPGTLIVRQDNDPNDGVDKNGYYYRNTPAVRAAWDGPNDVLNADILVHSNMLRGKYYAIHGNSKDIGVVYDIDFFKLFCEDKKIACMGTWINGDHGDTDPGVVRRPDNSSPVGLPVYKPTDSAGGHREVFSGPDSDVRLDRILPVFTHSTANHWGLFRGHYNLGLEWNSDTGNVTTASTLALPIRYRRHTGFGTGSVYVNGVPGPDTNRANWIPDQPTSATFDLTFRRTGSFGLPLGKVVNYSLPAHGAQSLQIGTATATDPDEITISGLTLENGTDYKTLTITAVP